MNPSIVRLQAELIFLLIFHFDRVNKEICDFNRIIASGVDSKMFGTVPVILKSWSNFASFGVVVVSGKLMAFAIILPQSKHFVILP